MAISLEDAHRHNDLNLLDRYKTTTIILGVVAIAKSRVEPVEEIRERLKAALEHIQTSLDFQPYSQTLASNYALQALAHDSLGESEQAATMLIRARDQFERSKGYHKNSGYLPYDAEVLLREAETKINGETASTDTNPTPSSKPAETPAEQQTEPNPVGANDRNSS